jgi:thiomorpholine-carboxylate dehydrogenase
MIEYLRETDVHRLLHWEPLIAAMETSLSALSSGLVTQPLRNWLAIEEGRRYFGLMPAAAEGALGVKLVTLYPANHERGLPTVMATILLFRPDTGEPLALIDGRAITAMRTAAVSAAITKRLAPPGSRVLALLGSGVEAAAHLAALRHVIPFDDVRVWSRNVEHAEKFAAEHGATAMAAEAAVRGADVVVTATAAREPILFGAWLEPGAHVNAIGAPMPHWRELDDAAMANVVVVESREAACAESGDIILSHAKIYAEVGEIFAGSIPAPTTQTTIYKSVGVAIEDIAAAEVVLEALHAERASLA